MYLLLLIISIPFIHLNPLFSVVVVCLTYLIKQDFDTREAQTLKQVEELKQELAQHKSETDIRLDSLRSSITGSKLGGLLGGR
jgi:hypothetical protein